MMEKLELPLFYVMVLPLNMFVFPSDVTYNRGVTDNHFACANIGSLPKNKIIKLFLNMDDLIIQCFFESKSELTSKEFLSVFTSGGLTPSLRIANSTYTSIFHFNLTLFSDRVYWLIDIPRENITQNTDLAAVDEWFVKITLQHGLNMYTTEGTLLDRLREPILHWQLGRPMSINEVRTLYPHVVDVKVTKCPCANDVAVFGFILNSTHDGVYVSLTASGLWDYNDLIWYNMTDLVYTLIEAELKELTLVDMVLTNHFLVILTSLGLYISGDLRYPSPGLIQLSRADFCGFERVDYVKGRLWYNERCYANKEIFEVDFVAITFERNKTLSESNTCFYSKEPFNDWVPCLTQYLKRNKSPHTTVLTFLVDAEHKTGVFLLRDQNSVTVSVNSLKRNRPYSKPKFPIFKFPVSFSSPVGMVFHPRSQFLYTYGNQVWMSSDGGNSFYLLADFHDDIIEYTFHSFYTSDITFLSKSGMVYLTKAGLRKYSKLGSISDAIYTLYYDHMGFIHKVTPDKFDAGTSIEAFGNSKGIFGAAPDMGFETPLAVQYITLTDMIFFAYVPNTQPVDTIYTKKFDTIHFGKVIQSDKIGTAYIKEILYHDSPEGFLSSVIAEVIQPFGLETLTESPCLASSLFIDEDTAPFYKLSLRSRPLGGASKFQKSDEEKTVVIPGYSSFLITEVTDDENALGVPTMLQRAPKNMTFQSDSWFLHNFGQKSGRTWKVYSRPCNYWFQHDSQSLSIQNYVDVGKSHSFKLKVLPNKRGSKTLGTPLLQVTVGNPNLLEVKTEGAFDYTDSYVKTVTVASRSLRRGSTSVALVIWDASTECYVTTVVQILKSSCSYLRSMHHIPSRIIPEEDWVHGIYTDKQGFNMIKTLPINYRPPSNMGIAIPLTDHFYHVDPSKPIPRNLFHKSKNSGKLKQCANVSTRAECKCTDAQKNSYSVAYSDCKEKVPRFKFPVTHYPISLEINTENGWVPIGMPYLVTVTEVNGRE
ncbi:cation channel sperm-associated auxiliary subunit beta, partial [Erinaceus europaeus]|uniref:Cation channel sperm-associated auxiliary subunit beta n=1 Tax=Erinaceus europaeus TaxID=9365 RepID=A0ABM3WLA6_ERIEU